MKNSREGKSPAPAPVEVLCLRVELLGVKPVIWRRIEIPVTHTLTGLHRVIQRLMGWHDSHLWAFRAGDRHFESEQPGMDHFGGTKENPAKTFLSDLLGRPDDSILYHYDFGDDWMIEVSHDGKTGSDASVRYPRCLAGERAGPPEDCGGPPGFEELLAARRNPRGPAARELMKWVSSEWNPDAFDIATVNKALASTRASRRIQ